MPQDIKIIGAGIAGLAAGCYLQMNGYRTEIFEMNKVPGGLCTSWKRKSYTIDTCIHWLVGTCPGDPLYHLWNELVDMKTLQIVDHDEFIRVEDSHGKCIRVFTDLERLEKEMLTKAPEDKELIREFIVATRRLLNFKMSNKVARETMSVLDSLKMIIRFMPYISLFKKFSTFSAGEYAKRCKNPLLRKTFEWIFLPDMSIIFLMFTLAWMHRKNAGYVIGGSKKFAQLVEKRYLELGGKIQYGSRVEKILTQDNKITGLLLDNGNKIYASQVISAADGHDTIFKMLEGKYINDKIKSYYSMYKLFPSYVQVSLGIADAFPKLPQSIYFPLIKPIVVDPGTKYDILGVHIYNFDPTLAPSGHTMLVALLPTYNDQYWTQLRAKDLRKYKMKKDQVAFQVITALRKKFGFARLKVKMIDVSTPATVIRYTNNYKGSFEGWLLTPQVGFKSMEKTLPGLENFYMIGQWVEPGGGLPTALLSGRNVTQIICKKDHRKFTTKGFTLE